MKKFKVIFKIYGSDKDRCPVYDCVIINADYFVIDSGGILILKNEGLLIGTVSFDTPVASFKEWSRITEYNPELD